MPGSHPPVPGLDVLVPSIALALGLLAGVLVYRHAAARRLDGPVRWAMLCGGCFVLGPLLLEPSLTAVYYDLFVPSGPGLLVRPVHALLTVVVGGALAGVGALVLYATQVARHRGIGSL